MNINNVYIASIWMLVDSRLIGDFITGSFKMSIRYVKTTAVYQKDGNWYDLKTKKKYYDNVYGLEPIGTQFIDFKRGLIPLNDKVEYKRENMTRRKILKKYDEVKTRGYINGSK